MVFMRSDTKPNYNKYSFGKLGIEKIINVTLSYAQATEIFGSCLSKSALPYLNDIAAKHCCFMYRKMI